VKSSKQTILNEAVTILRLLVKMYTSGKSSITCLPDIHKFSSLGEINKISPVLWILFLFKISSMDREDKEWLKNAGTRDKHYIEEPFNINITVPILHISSCFFNSQNFQCVQPLHLLMTDLCDKYSNSSSTFLSSNARLVGGSVSKDYFRRFITNRCSELEQKQRFIT